MTFLILFMWCHLLFVHFCDSVDEMQHRIFGNHLCICHFIQSKRFLDKHAQLLTYSSRVVPFLKVAGCHLSCRWSEQPLKRIHSSTYYEQSASGIAFPCTVIFVDLVYLSGTDTLWVYYLVPRVPYKKNTPDGTFIGIASNLQINLGEN